MSAMSNIEFLKVLLPALGYSTLCGGMIGFERARRGSAAGMKTQIFICVGSAIFTVCSVTMVKAQGSGDAGRLIAQIVSGVGFLGAGTIMARDRIIGLTTAAIIWVMAALGIMIGMGFGPAAIVVTLGMLVSIETISQIERRFTKTHACDHPHHAHQNLHLVDRSHEDEAKESPNTHRDVRQETPDREHKIG